MKVTKFLILTNLLLTSTVFAETVFRNRPFKVVKANYRITFEKDLVPSGRDKKLNRVVYHFSNNTDLSCNLLINLELHEVDQGYAGSEFNINEHRSRNYTQQGYLIYSSMNPQDTFPKYNKYLWLTMRSSDGQVLLSCGDDKNENRSEIKLKDIVSLLRANSVKLVKLVKLD